jgi:hypothetical protein
MEPPFRTQRVAAGPFFTDREREVRRVVDAMRGRQRLAVYGERRQGKTSVIARAAERLREGGGVVVMADAWMASDLAALNRDLVRSVPGWWLVGEKAQGLLRSLAGRVVLSADEHGNPQLGFSGGPGRDDRPEETFERVLRALEEAAIGGGEAVAVVIDEFQEVASLHPRGGALLRGVMQDTPGLAYVLAGSIMGAVEELIGPKGPLQGIDRLEVGGIDPDHLIPWLHHRLETHGVGCDRAVAEAIYDRAGPVTEYVVRLAKVVHRTGLAEGEASLDTVSGAFQEIIADQEGAYELIWAKLSPSKRSVLRALAAGETRLTSRAVLDGYGLGSSAAATYAINELRADGILAPGKPFRISDPFFHAWIAETA